MFTSQYAEQRYDDFCQTDLRVDKTFKFGRTRLIGSVDVFNAFNSGVVLAQITRQNASNANYVTTLLAPRVVRFGVRVQF